MRSLTVAVLFTLVDLWWAPLQATDAAVVQEREQLARLRDFVSRVSERVHQLEKALAEAEARNRRQSEEIDRLEKQLAARQAKAPDEQERLRRRFFAALAERLPLSPVYEIRDDRVIVPADLVFVFSRAQLGAEGQSRLQPLARALRELTGELPTTLPWRLRVEGHTDRRPLRSNREFPTNWELSAARATEMVRYLVHSGLPERRLEGVALAATRPLDDRRNRAAYRRNRRIELHLVFER
jgi:chemotaxis protein MotB